MKSLLVISLLLLGVCEGVYDHAFVKCYSGLNGGGKSIILRDSLTDMMYKSMDNDLESARQTGFWLYYGGKNFNVGQPRRSVFYGHGYDLFLNVQKKHRNTVSSIRHVNSLLDKGGDVMTLFDGGRFSGKDLAITGDRPTLGNMTGRVSSIIIIGKHQWTLYSGKQYTGRRHCLVPHKSMDPEKFPYDNVGMFPNMRKAGIPNGTVRSVKKGCFVPFSDKNN